MKRKKSTVQILSREPYELSREGLAAIDAQYRKEAKEIDRLVRVERLRYRVGGEEYVGFIAAPRIRRRKTPAVVFNRGGNHSFGLIDPGIVFGRMGKIATWGYTVIASQYPGSDGGTGAHEFGGADIESVLALKELLSHERSVDAERIGMYGASRGAMMTFLAMARVDWIKSAVVLGSLTNLETVGEDRPEMLDVYKRYFPVTRRALRARSAQFFAEKLCKGSPLLMLHGGADVACRPKDALVFSQRLLDVGFPHRFILYEKGDHGLRTHWEEHNLAVRGWFDASLMTRPRRKSASTR